MKSTKTHTRRPSIKSVPSVKSVDKSSGSLLPKPQTPNPKPASSPLPTRLVALRKMRGYTQVDLARCAHLSQQAIAHYEVGRRTPNETAIVQLAAALECSVSDLDPDRTLPVPADLLPLAEQWPLLPPAVRGHILALIRALVPGK